MMAPSIIKFLVVITVALRTSIVAAKPSILSISGEIKTRRSSNKPSDDAFQILARSIQTRLNAPINSEITSTTISTSTISSALKSLSTTQAALKKIDGSAHELYQRTNKSTTSYGSDENDEERNDGEGRVGGLKVKGRMQRNAARVGCLADALFAAELCVINLQDDSEDGDGGTLASWTGRKVVFNSTIESNSSDSDLAISVLIVHEKDYSGGAGIKHGGVDDLLSFAQEEIEEEVEDGGTGGKEKARGRYLVILSDYRRGSTSSSCDLPSIISILDTPPEHIKLPFSTGKGGDEDSASVCDPLYHTAGKVLKAIKPVIMRSSEEASDGDDSKITDNEAIHFVGYSLAGGVAAISANILEGKLPFPHKRNSKKQQQQYTTLSGCCRERTSALCVGMPPCISSNIQSPFVTCVIHGDDIVCRTTHLSINHLCDRLHKSIKGGLLGRSVGWMSEAVTLTVSSLKSDKDKAGKLALPGNVFLIRPRRIGGDGGSSSIHEVGGNAGKESLRAALLWQLNEVLLSKSLWQHHRMDAYIRSLDKVKLKGFADNDSE